MSSRSLFLSALSAVAALSLLGAGCSGTGPSTEASGETRATGSSAVVTPDRSSPGFACNHEYYPLRTGYRIQYQTTYPAAPGSTGSGRYSMTVASVTADAANLQTTFERGGGAADIQSDMVYRCSGGALQAKGFVNMGYGPLGGGEGIKVVTRNSSGEFLPQDVAPGREWTSTFDVEMQPPAGSELFGRSPSGGTGISMSIMIKRKAVRVEPVTVAGRSFEAMRVDSEVSFDGTGTLAGTEWWVKDVGMVKSVFNAGSGDVTTVATAVTVPGGIEIR